MKSLVVGRNFLKNEWIDGSSVKRFTLKDSEVSRDSFRRDGQREEEDSRVSSR